MSDENEKKINVTDEVDANCFRMFGYVPSELTEINEVLDDCDTLINYHMENTAAISEGNRECVANLAIRKELLNIEIDDIFLVTLDHIKKAREMYFTNAKPKDFQKDVKFIERLAKVKENVRKLLHEIKDYVESLDKGSCAYK